jgi:hypothetical protein
MPKDPTYVFPSMTQDPKSVVLHLPKALKRVFPSGHQLKFLDASIRIARVFVSINISGWLQNIY